MRYIYNMLSNRLAHSYQVTLPKSLLDENGVSLDSISKYFIFEKGSFGLIHFLGFR